MEEATQMEIVGWQTESYQQIMSHRCTDVQATRIRHIKQGNKTQQLKKANNLKIKQYYKSKTEVASKKFSSDLQLEKQSKLMKKKIKQEIQQEKKIKFDKTKQEKTNQKLNKKQNTKQKAPLNIQSNVKIFKELLKQKQSRTLQRYQSKIKSQKSQLILTKTRQITDIRFKSQVHVHVHAHQSAQNQQALSKLQNKQIKQRTCSNLQLQKQLLISSRNLKSKKNKQNFDNKELIFCSTMLQRQRLQKIQSIFYKSKQKNSKNKHFLVHTDKMPTQDDQNYIQQLKVQVRKGPKHYLTQNYSLQRQKQSNFTLQKPSIKKTRNIQHQHRLFMTKNHNGHQQQLIIDERLTIDRDSSLDNKKIKDSDENEKFKYFPQIFKITMNKNKSKDEHQNQAKNSNFRSHGRNLSELFNNNRLNHLKQLKNSQKSKQSSFFNEFNDNIMSQLKQKISTNPLKITQQFSTNIARKQ